MNYLLDTHTFLWAIFLDEKLSPRVKKVITNPENNIYVSMVSFWEISLKYSLKKLTLNNIFPDDLPDIAKKSGFELFPLNYKDAAGFHQLPNKIHKDPFDRILIWQSINNNFILISKDKLFQLYKNQGFHTIW